MFGEKILNWISQNKTMVIILTIMTIGFFMLVLLTTIAFIFIIRFIRNEKKENIKRYEEFQQLKSSYDLNVTELQKFKNTLKKVSDDKDVSPQKVLYIMTDLLIYRYDDNLLTYDETKYYLTKLNHRLYNISNETLKSNINEIFELLDIYNELYRQYDSQANKIIDNFINKFNSVIKSIDREYRFTKIKVVED